MLLYLLFILLRRWFLEGETKILVLINQFYHRIDFFHYDEASFRSIYCELVLFSFRIIAILLY